jgi:N-acylglucosamine 2-epimerase
LQWNEKVWWSHAEALCALLMCARREQDEEMFTQFLELYRWCRAHFADKEYGEWYTVLNADGTPRMTDKGGLQKAAFHIPRALMFVDLELQAMIKGLE